jgi:hypothetical protein
MQLWVQLGSMSTDQMAILRKENMTVRIFFCQVQSLTTGVMLYTRPLSPPAECASLYVVPKCSNKTSAAGTRRRSFSGFGEADQIATAKAAWTSCDCDEDTHNQHIGAAHRLRDCTRSASQHGLLFGTLLSALRSLPTTTMMKFAILAIVATIAAGKTCNLNIPNKAITWADHGVTGRWDQAINTDGTVTANEAECQTLCEAQWNCRGWSYRVSTLGDSKLRQEAGNFRKCWMVDESKVKHRAVDAVGHIHSSICTAVMAPALPSARLSTTPLS